MCVCIYMYACMHVNVCVYIRVCHIERESLLLGEAESVRVRLSDFWRRGRRKARVATEKRANGLRSAGENVEEAEQLFDGHFDCEETQHEARGYLYVSI